MRLLSRTVVCLVAVIGLGLAAAATSPAQGGGGNSAGNSQYIDPLHNGGSGRHHSGHGSGSGTQTTPSSQSSTSSSGSSTLSPSAPSGVGSSSATQVTGRQLPYTGLNLEACVALGLGLLLAGFGLRRVLAAYR